MKKNKKAAIKHTTNEIYLNNEKKDFLNSSGFF